VNKETPWLRLVYDSRDVPEFGRKVEADPAQLSFPFPEPDIVVVLDVAHFHYVTFKRALDKIKPRWIFDIRAAPRLDRLAGTRSHAFRYFDHLGIRYIDVFGLVGISNYKKAIYNPNFWTPVIEDFLSDAGGQGGPYCALLDDDSMINSVSKHLASSVSHATGKSVSLSKLTSDNDFHFYV
jgi:hypothetical protein